MLSDTDIDEILQPIYDEMAQVKALADIARLTDLVRKKAITITQWSAAVAFIRKTQQSRRLDPPPSIALPPPTPRLPPPQAKNSDIIYNELMKELDREDVAEVRRIKRREEKRRNRARKCGSEPPAYVNALLSQDLGDMPPPPQYSEFDF
jgi:hypothetical protein